MAISAAASMGVTILSPALKDLYEQSKGRFGSLLSKWNNARAVQGLVNKVNAYERVKTIWQREKDVKLSSFYFPSKINFNTGITKTISSLRDIPPVGFFVIQGTVGQGKSVFLRYLCTQELKSNSSGRIPIFLELRKLDEKFNLADAVQLTLKNLGFEISLELFEYYAESGKIVLLLDGFDELNEKLALPTIRQLESWAIEFPSMQIIVTSRPGSDIQKCSHFKIIRLAPLTPKDHKPFLTKIGVKGESLENILQAIEDSPSEIKNLLTTPLLLTLVVLVYQVENSIPSELPEFFKLLFVTVFSRHDGTKPAFLRMHKSGLTERKLEQLFESFCFAVKRRRLRVSLTEEEFNTAFEDGSRFFTDKCTAEGFKHDIIKVACLMQEDGLFITFVHKSLLDYFSAGFVSTRTEKQAQQIYSSIIENPRDWRPTLQFLQHIDRYRYARDFAVPELKRSLDFLSTDENGKIPEDLNSSIFQKMFGNALLRFSRDEGTTTIRSAGFGPYYDPELYFFDSFIDEVLEIKHVTEIFATETDFLAKYPDAKFKYNDDHLSIEAPFTSVVSQEQMAQAFSKFDKFRNLLEQMKSQFENIVALEDSHAELLASFDVYE